MNIILDTDSYKVSHYRQYPKGAQYLHSYLEARGGEYENVVFFGALRYYLSTLLGVGATTERPVSLDAINEAEEMFAAHFGDTTMFNRTGWEYILRKYNGFLPLRIRTVAEGTIVPVSNVLMTVENTDPNVPWLTNYVETRLMQMWYPITVATLSFHCRRIILAALEQSGDPDGIDFKLHDFGYRGSTSQESAMLGGLAHLINFKGTDTMAALMAAKRYYNCPMAGFSIPAAEHSTITSWGQEHEVDAYRNMLRQYPTGLVAVVSDSYDIYAACEKLWGEVLRDEVLGRFGTLVVRPDSGYPPDVVVKCLEILGSKFGYMTNQKGYKVLNPHVRLIQGDGCTPKMIATILDRMMGQGWSADNVAFGMGGALLQGVTRDTCQFAFKASNIVVNDVSMPVHKNPATMRSKRSKPGRLSLFHNPHENAYRTVDIDNDTLREGEIDVMDAVYDIHPRSIGSRQYGLRPEDRSASSDFDTIRARVREHEARL